MLSTSTTANRSNVPQLRVETPTLSPLNSTLNEYKRKIDNNIDTALRLLDEISPAASPSSDSKVAVQLYCLHYLIGIMYRDGEGTEPNKTKAVHHLFEAYVFRDVASSPSNSSCHRCEDHLKDIGTSLYRLILGGQLLNSNDIRKTLAFLTSFLTFSSDYGMKCYDIAGETYFYMAKLEGLANRNWDAGLYYDMAARIYSHPKAAIWCRNNLTLSPRDKLQYDTILKELKPAQQFELALEIKQEFPSEAVNLFDAAAAAKIPGALKEYLDLCKEPIDEKVRKALLSQAANFPNADAEEVFRYAEILYQRDLKKPEPFIGKREFDSLKYFQKAAAKNHVMAQSRMNAINAINAPVQQPVTAPASPSSGSWLDSFFSFSKPSVKPVNPDDHKIN